MKNNLFIILFLFLSFQINAQCIIGNGSNISLTNTDNCYSGTIGVLQMNNKNLTVASGSTLEIKNINGVGKITIESGALLRVTSSINMNGGFTIINDGILYTETIEMQNGVNILQNSGTIGCKELQISSAGSTLSNCGSITVSNATNLHAGTFNLCNCGSLITSLLNVNATIVKGSGVITVTNVLNLNAVLSNDDSGALALYYPGKINKPENLGTFVLNGTCSKPLPVDIVSWGVTRVGNKLRLKLVFSRIVNVKTIYLKGSNDLKNWDVKLTIDPNKIIPNKEYTVDF